MTVKQMVEQIAAHRNSNPTHNITNVGTSVGTYFSLEVKIELYQILMSACRGIPLPPIYISNWHEC